MHAVRAGRNRLEVAETHLESRFLLGGGVRQRGSPELCGPCDALRVWPQCDGGGHRPSTKPEEVHAAYKRAVQATASTQTSSDNTR